MARTHLDPEAWARKVRIRRIVLISLASVLLTALAAFLLIRDVILPAKRYSRAEEALEQGNVAEAIDRFSAMRGYKDAWERAEELVTSSQVDEDALRTIQSAKLGEIVSFGQWEQDGNTKNGSEPIEWIVLADDDGRVLLWSNQILDMKPFHEPGGAITWAESTLRAWLNDTFYQDAFTPEERLLVSMTELQNVDNSASGADGGEDTEDHVFLLSFNELLAFGLYNPFLEDISATATPYAISRGVERHQEWGTSPWWTRSPGINQSSVTFCDMAGVPIQSSTTERTGFGVRPVIWVFAPGRTQTPYGE